MNRALAASEISNWRAAYDTGLDQMVRRRHMRALLAAAEWFQTETGRLETIVREDTARFALLEKALRDLRQTAGVADVEHVEADPAGAIQRAMGGTG